MTVKNYYFILGVPRGATAEQVRSAYRLLVRKYHPDLNHSPWAEEKLKSLNEAYEVLGDPDKRREYDTTFPAPFFFRGSAATPPPGAAPRATTPPPRESARAGRPATPGKGPLRPQRGEDMDVKLLLPMEDAALGGMQEVTLNLPELDGARTFHVRIPAGIQPGQRIRLKGQGRAGFMGGEAGDMLLVVEFAPHPRFRLDGLDLHTSLLITPWEAALGMEVPLPVLNGQVLLRIPAGSSSGRKVRLRGKGFPVDAEQVGDMLVELIIAVPDRLTMAEKRYFRKLAEASTFNPREPG